MTLTISEYVPPPPADPVVGFDFLPVGDLVHAGDFYQRTETNVWSDPRPVEPFMVGLRPKDFGLWGTWRVLRPKR